MLVFRYDKTFEGLLSAIFDAFRLKKYPEKLIGEFDICPLLATEEHLVCTEKMKFTRVGQGLKKNLSPYHLKLITYVWLSEEEQSDELLFRYIHKVFSTKKLIATDYADVDISVCQKLANKVAKEAGFMRRFVRFKTIIMDNEKVYVAVISSQYNVLSLTVDFFYNRYRDQKWAIYDHERHYGYFYDLNTVEYITLDQSSDLVVGHQLNAQFLTEEEHFFEKMWYRYCQSVTIKERINLKQQRGYMPQRFWKYLPEMVHQSL